MSNFAEFYAQLHMRPLTSDNSDICSSSNTSRSAATPFPINVAHRVDTFNKIAKRTSTPISCWKFTYHLNSTIILL